VRHVLSGSWTSLGPRLVIKAPIAALGSNDAFNQNLVSKVGSF
jgi:hypothetical protein